MLISADILNPSLIIPSPATAVFRNLKERYPNNYGDTPVIW